MIEFVSNENGITASPSGRTIFETLARLLPRLFLGLCLISWVVLPQGRGQLELQRLQGPIILDGLSKEPAWEAITPLPLTMYLPVFQGQVTERSEIRVAYDDEYFYASGRFYDSDPSGIRINSLYRDRWSGDDAFALYIDTFNDNENSLWFLTTPAGIRGDYAISGDAEIPENASWNTFWDAETKVTNEGWFAEIRIPLSSLRFNVVDGKVVMGLTVTRLIARKNERVTFPAIDPKYTFRKPSIAQDVMLKDIHSRKPFYITPYVLGGGSQTAQLDAQNTEFQYKSNLRKEIGLDAKYNLTDNLTLDMTVNTDFAQVEVDDQQINLTRFSLFYPEKRQFFQERASLFRFDMGDGNRLLHTRRIGLTNAGDPIHILGGARLVGKVGEWDMGFLNMQTANEFSSPSENFGVLRMRRQIVNPYSYAGGIVTSRIEENGKYNATYGVDGVVRVVDDEYLTLKWSQSLDEQYLKANGNRPFETGQGLFTWERRSNKGLAYDISLTRTGSDYNPGIGFVQHSGYTYFKGVVDYFIYPGDDDVLRNHSWNNVTLARFRNADGKLESLYFAPWWEFESKAGATGWIEPRLQFEDVPVAFQLSEGTNVPAGNYWFFDFWFNYRMSSGELLSTNADVIIGSFYDGWRATTTLAPTWHVSKHLELGGSYQVNVIQFPDRDQSLTSHIARLRIQTAFDEHASAQAYLQYNSVAHGVGLNALLRYNFAEGTDLWIVYNHNINTDRDRQSPALPLLGSNTLIFKYTNTFSL
jgi:hypothetical protein